MRAVVSHMYRISRPKVSVSPHEITWIFGFESLKIIFEIFIKCNVLIYLYTSTVRKLLIDNHNGDKVLWFIGDLYYIMITIMTYNIILW